MGWKGTSSFLSLDAENYEGLLKQLWNSQGKKVKTHRVTFQPFADLSSKQP